MSAYAKATAVKAPFGAKSGARHTGKAGCGCDACKKKGSVLRRAAVSPHAPAEIPSIVHEVLRSPGEPLDRKTRAFMEDRLSHGFSHVRVHKDQNAAKSADAIEARAYTFGHQIVFGHSEYSPATLRGTELLAHELVHVIQQHSGLFGDTPSKIIDIGDGAELEATRIASSIYSEANHQIAGRTSRAIARVQKEGMNNAGCGLCGRPMDIGNEVHAIIQQRFTAEYEEYLEATPEYTEVKGHRPDLVLKRNGMFFVGEIKAANTIEFNKGKKKIDTYIDAFKNVKTNIPIVRLMDPFPINELRRAGAVYIGPYRDTVAPSGPYSECIQSIYLNPPLSGVYTYFCEPTNQALRRLPECSCEKNDPKDKIINLRPGRKTDGGNSHEEKDQNVIVLSGRRPSASVGDAEAGDKAAMSGDQIRPPGVGRPLVLQSPQAIMISVLILEMMRVSNDTKKISEMAKKFVSQQPGVAAIIAEALVVIGGATILFALGLPASAAALTALFVLAEAQRAPRGIAS